MEGMSANEKAKTRYFANKFDYYDYSNNYISGDSNFQWNGDARKGAVVCCYK